MAKKAPAPPAAEAAPAAKKKWKSPVPISTIITFLVALPIGYWCFNSYRKWTGIKAAIVTRDTKLADLRANNAALSVVYDNVQLKKFQACNKTADQITINWLAVAYHDGQKVQIFNSDQCQDFKAPVLVPGDDKSVLLRSSQPGCNWDGSVFYYAMRFTQENEESEKYQVNQMVGPYQGFDRDCYSFR
jgi:hypothetical protein